ncbi:hypothetical protein ABID22_002830 [Pontibacter aydingkolensis]|uniref:Uncharacterized protein n=1 Tax=Pontibacter aydingkolensis TaxID=1911536 RepID=A0ABS7CXA8_9BACT|nr:hypothetical protein [Pontibacter aydingkolensis]MBW7468418.1 hypothetical protein [Pontibacter aydingkolensis]
MDLETLIIGAISLAVFIVPIILIQSKQKAKKNKLLSEFLASGEQQQLRITQYDFWNQCYGIGLDEVQQKLFYANKCAGKEQQLVINLAEVSKCRLVSEKREVNGNVVFDLIGLHISFRNPKLPDQHLEFYNKEISLSLMDELQLAEKWNALSNKLISGAKASEKQPGSLAVPA